MPVGTNVTKLGAWSETFKVAIAPYGCGSLSTFYQFEGLIQQDSLDIDEGDRTIENIPIGGGGRVTKMGPKGDTVIKMVLYPLDLTFSTSNAGISQGFRDIQANWDTTDQFDSTDTRNRDTFMVVILFTDDSAVATQANAAAAASTNSFRWTAAHCYMTSYKLSFTEGVLTATVEFIVPASSKFGALRIHECATRDTNVTGLTAIATFNSTNFSPTVAAGTAFTWH